MLEYKTQTESEPVTKKSFPKVDILHRTQIQKAVKLDLTSDSHRLHQKRRIWQKSLLKTGKFLYCLWTAHFPSNTFKADAETFHFLQIQQYVSSLLTKCPPSSVLTSFKDRCLHGHSSKSLITLLNSNLAKRTTFHKTPCIQAWEMDHHGVTWDSMHSQPLFFYDCLLFPRYQAQENTYQQLFMSYMTP